jgi:hypothetical protein
VTRRGGLLQQARSWWLAAWPCWALLIFASLAAVRFLPEGYARTIVAAPILLLVPGSLTLEAVFGERRPRGTAFVCFAALLSVICSAFASLAIYAIKVLITAGSTYWCLLIVTAVLAALAQTRLTRSHRTARGYVITDPGRPVAGADAAGTSAATGRSGYYAIAAVAAGLILLGGGAYAMEHVSHPAPAGYTWMAWTGKRIEGPIPIGSAGTKLPFQIVHRQSYATTFQLRATWLGTRSRLLARPVTLSIGPNRTVRGALFVPPLHNGCTYRIVLALTSRQIDPLTQKRQEWSINANVRAPGKSMRACRR